MKELTQRPAEKTSAMSSDRYQPVSLATATTAPEATHASINTNSFIFSGRTNRSG
jgi:hypothetical protein